MSDVAIKLQGIHKTYPGTAGNPPVYALRGIDLEVARGAVFCILGPNGAGKTTLISILAGLLYPDAGAGQVCSLDLTKDRRRIRRIVNFASGHANLPDNFTAVETLNYFGMLYGLPKAVRLKRIDHLIEFFELGSQRKTPFNQLSTGLKQRLALAKSLINDPRILFLDEPTVGLDPNVSLLIRDRLRQLNRDHQTTLILTTHQMDEAEQMSDRIGFLKEGRFVRLASAEQLKKGIHFQDWIVVSGRNLGAGLERLGKIPGVSCSLVNRQRIKCRVDSRENQLHLILRELILAGASIDDIDITQATLGDVFVALAEQSDPD